MPAGPQCHVSIEKGFGPEGRVAVVRFDRGGRLNALSPAVMLLVLVMVINRLAGALDELAAQMDTDQFAPAGSAEDDAEGVAAFLAQKYTWKTARHYPQRTYCDQMQAWRNRVRRL